jgi:hypothetical protein
MEDTMADSRSLEVQQKKELVSKEEKTVPARYYVPYTDIYETDEALTVVMEMPAVERKCSWLPAGASAHGDRPRLVAFGAGEIERENAVAVFRLDAVGVDLDRDRDGAVELPGRPLAPVQARLVAVLDGLGSSDTDRPALDLDLQIRLPDAGHLGNEDEIVALAEDVERRIGAAGARARLEPVAGSQRVERLLEIEKRIERIG